MHHSTLRHNILRHTQTKTDNYSVVNTINLHKILFATINTILLWSSTETWPKPKKLKAKFTTEFSNAAYDPNTTPSRQSSTAQAESEVLTKPALLFTTLFRIYRSGYLRRDCLGRAYSNQRIKKAIV
ncbi:MAG: hypothetical protein M2R46_02753 [Verrucomicrobia subdivision 3 bacterium]|nr:hypothetical protein [Limisphaerales bacterium]